MDRLHQPWTRQLLRRSTLVPRPSMLKLVSLPLASGVSLRLTLGDATDNEVMLYRKGGHNRERNCHIPCISPPLDFVLRLRSQEGGRICGTLRYYVFVQLVCMASSWSLRYVIYRGKMRLCAMFKSAETTNLQTSQAHFAP